MNVRPAHIVAIAPFMAASRTKVRGRPDAPVDEATAGGRLRALRKRQGMDQDQVATVLGVSRPMISRYEMGMHTMPDHFIERASHLFGVTPAFIRYGDTESRMIQVRGRVGAGAHVEAIDAPPWRYVEVPASWGDAVALEISGDSAWPIYEDRDVIVIRGPRRLEEHEFLGKLSVVETADGMGLLKRVRRGSAAGLYTLESANAPTIEDVPLVSARPIKMSLKG